MTRAEKIARKRPRRWWYAVEIDEERYVPIFGGIGENNAPALFDTRARAEADAFLDHGEKIEQVKLVRRRTGWKGKRITRR